MWLLCDKKQEINITPFVDNLYFVYFKVKLGDQDKKWASLVMCKACAESLRQWFYTFWYTNGLA
jgi:hypothetical protein